jgi:pyruvate formate lyase activating enzyme
MYKNKSLITYGKQMSVEEVVKEIMKDNIFYFHSEGGVTLSGGEVLSQADFAAAILEKCSEMGIDTAIDTSLYSNYKNIEKILPWIDRLLVDIKHMENEEHKKWVGVDNNVILDNLKKIDNSEFNLKIYVRIPIIPSINDNENNLTKIAYFCKDIIKLEEIELLPYHRLGIDTYKKLGREYELKNIVLPTKEHINNLAEFISEIVPEINIKANGKNIGV